MKNNLENAFKNSLQDYEVPYDPKAWEAVSSKLGAQPTAGGSMMTSVLKWGLAVVLFGAVATGAIFLLDNQEEITTAEVNQTRAEEKIEHTSHSNDIIVSSTDSTDEKNIEPTETGSLKVEQVVENKNIVSANDKSSNKTQSSTPVTVNESSNQVNDNGRKNDKGTKANELVREKFVAGHISSASVCEGEAVYIFNKDDNAKVRFKLNDEWVVIQPGKSMEMKLNSSTELVFVDDNDQVIETSFLKVQNLPSANFTFDANIYEGGLPVVVCEAYGDNVKYEWSFDNELKRNGSEVKHNFFDKGDYEVVLKVTDRNGCESTTTKTVRIRDKYNLMAVDAFKPNGSDSRNRTFMPYSLTERDVKFQLTIYDPIDNGIVFSSNDANNAWDGIDHKTGKMTPENKAYVWKVQIFNPLPNERPIYAGTIVHN